MQTLTLLRPLPPHVSKCWHLIIPYPPSNCRRLKWTPPNQMIPKIPKESKRTKEVPKESKRLQRHLKDSKWFQNFPKDSKNIQKSP